MATWTSPDRLYKINLTTDTFLKEPDGNTLSTKEAQALYQNLPAPASEDVILGDFLQDLANREGKNITNIPNNHFN